MRAPWDSDCCGWADPESLVAHEAHTAKPSDRRSTLTAALISAIVGTYLGALDNGIRIEEVVGEEAVGGAVGWLSLLQKGRCSAFAASFAERGAFTFQYDGRQLDLSTRAEVQDICERMTVRIKAVRMRRHFFDYNRGDTVALWEEFYADSDAVLLRQLHAFYAEVSMSGGRLLINRFIDVLEQRLDQQSPHVRETAEAEMLRRAQGTCSGYENSLGKDVDVIAQFYPEVQHGYDSALAFCQGSIKQDLEKHWFSHDEIKGVFASLSSQVAIIFFDLEKLAKDRLIFSSMPQVFVLELSAEDGRVAKLRDWEFETIESLGRVAFMSEHQESAGAALLAAAKEGRRVSLSGEL